MFIMDKRPEDVMAEIEAASDRVSALATPGAATQPNPPSSISAPSVSVEFRDVSKDFVRGRRATTAITKVNAVVENNPGESEFVCIIGPSGCGKSTLMSLLAGYDTHIPPTTGDVEFHGITVQTPGPERGMIFQEYNCYPHLTVLENIAFGLKIHAKELHLSNGDITETAMTWLRHVKLQESDAGKYPRELSGGMRQRVAIARTVALRPKCLLMDEPFSALDEPTRYGMQDLVVELRSKTEMTILMVSHSVSEAVYLGDRVWVMSPAPGTIVAEFVGLPFADAGMSAMDEQSKPQFAASSAEIKQHFNDILNTPREQMVPICADGKGGHPVDEKGV